MQKLLAGATLVAATFAVELDPLKNDLVQEQASIPRCVVQIFRSKAAKRFFHHVKRALRSCGRSRRCKHMILRHACRIAHHWVHKLRCYSAHKYISHACRWAHAMVKSGKMAQMTAAMQLKI